MGVGIEAGGSRGELGHIISVIISVIIYNNSIIIYNSLLCIKYWKMASGLSLRLRPAVRKGTSAYVVNIMMYIIYNYNKNYYILHIKWCWQWQELLELPRPLAR